MSKLLKATIAFLMVVVSLILLLFAYEPYLKEDFLQDYLNSLQLNSTVNSDAPFSFIDVKQKFDRNTDKSKAFQIYKIYTATKPKTLSLDEQLAFIVFIIPGYQQQFKDFQSLMAKLTKDLEFHKCEIYLFDFANQPSAYFGEILKMQSQYVTDFIKEVTLKQTNKKVGIQIIAFDTGITVAYQVVSSPIFPLAHLWSVISLHNDQRTDLTQKYSPFPQYQAYEVTQKLLHYQLKSNTFHLAIKICRSSHSINPDKTFFKLFSNQLKFYLELATNEVQEVNKCYDHDENFLRDDALNKAISKVVKNIGDPEYYNTKVRLERIQEQINMNLDFKIKDVKEVDVYFDIDQAKVLGFNKEGVAQLEIDEDQEVFQMEVDLEDDSSFYLALSDCGNYEVYTRNDKGENFQFTLSRSKLQVHNQQLEFTKMTSQDLKRIKQHLNYTHLYFRVLKDLELKICTFKLLRMQNVSFQTLVVSNLQNQAVQQLQSSYGVEIINDPQNFFLGEFIPLKICSNSYLLCNKNSNFTLIQPGCSYFKLKDLDRSVYLLPLIQQDKISIELSLDYQQYALEAMSNSYAIIQNSIAMIFVYLISHLFKPKIGVSASLLNLMLQKMPYISVMLYSQSLLYWYLQDVIVEYGFMNYDHYQIEYTAFEYTKVYALMVPFVSYALALLVMILLNIVKYIIFWPLYRLFDILPKCMAGLRTTTVVLLQVTFLFMIGIGYSMTLYSMICYASFLSFIGVAIKYSKVSKLAIKSKDQQRIKEEKRLSWNLLDFMLLIIMFQLQYYERFILESWRLKETINFPYSYDNDWYFYHSITLFSLSFIIASRRTIVRLMQNFGRYILRATSFLIMLTSYDMIYRQRFIYSVGLISTSILLLIGGCTVIAKKKEKRDKAEQAKMQKERKVKKVAIVSKRVEEKATDKIQYYQQLNQRITQLEESKATIEESQIDEMQAEEIKEGQYIKQKKQKKNI